MILAEHFARLRPMVVRPAAGFLRYDYCVPGGFYEELWDWDGFFIAVHLANREPPQPQYLKFWTLNFIAAADENGYAPGCVTTQGPEPGHRSFQMKPFLAQGAELSARLLNETDWLAANYDAIVRIATLREKTHRDANTGLFFWDNAMQSGADNNPAITNEPQNARKILSCDINAFQWREYLALAKIAQRLGWTTDARQFQASANALQSAINTHLWDETTGAYWNRHRETGDWVKRLAHSNFVPLWAGLASVGRGRRMIENYLWNSQHMLSPFGLRSLSKSDPLYNNQKIIWPHSNWQGPIWLIANFFYFGALRRYGFHDEVKRLVEMLTAICLRDLETCGSMHENYHADTGEPLAPSADQPPRHVEGGFIGWNLLLQDMSETINSKPDILALPHAENDGPIP